MGSIWRRLQFLWGSFLLTLVPAAIILYRNPEAFGGQLQKYMTGWSLVVVVYSIYLFLSFRPAGTILPVSQLVHAIVMSEIEYCLILRPFGSDGFVPLRVALPPGSIRETLLKPVALSKTLEGVLESEVRRVFGCQCVALVDPTLKVVPLSPQYFASDHDSWRDVIDTLLRRALVVAVILPPSQNVRNALHWEVNRAVELGLLGRLLLVLPPPSAEGGISSRFALEELADVLIGLECAPSNSILIYANPRMQLEWFWVTGGEPVDSTYAEVFRTVFAQINADVKDRSFAQRYPYWRPRPKLAPKEP